MQVTWINEWLANEFTRALAWTLIHSLWQGLAAAIITGIIILCTKRSTAALRYNLLSAVFILFMATAFITFFIKYNSYNEIAAGTPQAIVQLEGSKENISASKYNVHLYYGSFTDSISSWFDQNAPLVVLTWFMVFVFQCLKIFSGFYYIQRMRRKGLAAPGDAWKERLQLLCSKLGIRQSVQFMQSHLVSMPLVVGYLKPIILVPVGMLNNLPVEQVETILLHELAHIRRKDYLVNLLQTCAETIFFFNPATRWMSALIREEREACCDDIVVASTTNKTTYLQALVNFNDPAINKNGYAMALAGKQNSLLNRVKRMLNYENKKLNIMEKLILVSGLVVFTAFGMVNAKETRELTAPAILHSPAQPMQVDEEDEQQIVLPAAVVAQQGEVPVIAGAEVVYQDTTRKTRKTTYEHVSTKVSTDGNSSNGEAIEILIKDENGEKTYKAKKVGNKITDLHVNGVRIADAEMGAYKDVIQEIEDAIQKGEEARKRGEEAWLRGEEARARGEEARKRGEEARVRGEEARKLGEEARIRGEEARKRGEEAMKRGEEARKREEARARGEEARKRGEEARIRGEESRKMIEDIVDELVKEKVITDKNNLRFTLSNSSLEVNGVKQSAALHNKLKKFVEDGNTITYSTSDSSTRVSINKN
ncbi:M56 family metallopeptidase [Aridibaculum aurantiacum]|uniref:M56 family metallopeptidase n=1 Tax=Aridibaculum aurantiacum TaxID=2810307 RepID=UPI001A9729BF|nr:M56 family metallopeptidase [Aridibaculum aurantiacum]